MVDLRPFQAGIDKALKESPSYGLSSNPRADFALHLSNCGFRLKSEIILSKIVRIADPQDKGCKKTGWYIYYEVEIGGNIFAVGVCGSYHGIPFDRDVWTSKRDTMLTNDQRHEYNLALEAAKANEERLRIELQNEAADRAVELWEKAKETTIEENPYCVRKKALIHNFVKHDDGCLIIPITLGEKLYSIQRIKNEGEFLINGEPIGNKKNLTGGRKKGCYYKINGDDGLVCVCEGYATGSSIWQATGATVYCAIDSGNLYEVAAYVKNNHQDSRIIICADNDFKTTGNAGITKGTQTSQALMLELIHPSDECGLVDFNDVHCELGLDAVKAYFEIKQSVYKKKKRENEEKNAMRPSGILGEIVDYYLATSGHPHMGFAVQSALSTCSVVCARNYKTNHGAKTSLLLLSIGETGIGKEHMKNIMEAILDASGKSDLIGGDSYSSGTAVVSALQIRPRHVSVIDEFQKHLIEANNKNSNGLMESANKKITEAFSKTNSTIRHMNYAGTGLTKEKQKEITMPIHHPALTILGMCPPEAFFDNISLKQVNDGFMNRFLVYISDAEKEEYQYKEMFDVPQSIVDWVTTIENRHGNGNENFSIKPKEVTLQYEIDAISLQKDFERWCIAKGKELDKFGMKSVMTRSPELAGRVTLLHALSRDPMAETIKKEDVEWSKNYVQFCFESLIDAAKSNMKSSEFEGMKLECLRAFRKAGDHGVSEAELQIRKPFSKYRGRDMKEIIEALTKGYQIFMGVRRSNGKGRPINVYLAKGD